MVSDKGGCSAEDWVPPTIDVTKPSVARIYDYFLGGKDNFAVDRQAAAEVLKLAPDTYEGALANRSFLVHAVRTMATAGVRQFLDLGTGIPTSPSVHEVAREICPQARVVYVDNDPIVMAHNRALLAREPGVVTVMHDVRDPGAVFEDPLVRQTLDFSEPVGMLMIALLHFIPVSQGPHLMESYRKQLAPGSHLAVSVACSDGASVETLAKIEKIYDKATAQGVFRTRAQIQELFEGFHLLEPGLGSISQWRRDGQPGTLPGLFGIGVK
ncbi:MAG: hypothetical protein QG608_2300 [Actinomycetota bacterium]|nr:hypothetical protein [Actinomycetota bacterium]